MPIRPRTVALGAGACLALLAAVWFTAFHSWFFGHADQAIYLQFGDLQGHGRIDWIAGHLVRAFDPNPYVYLGLLPPAVALLRGRPRLAFAAAVIILGANVTTELLKPLLAAPRPDSLFNGGTSPLPAASWPSGHSTAVMSLVLASVVVAPARLRPAVAALGTSLAIAVSYSVLATGMHYPSDVLGGFLVAATWTLLAVAVLLAAERRRPSTRTGAGPVPIRAALRAPGAVLLAAAILTTIVVVSRPHDIVADARAHEAFVFGAVGIAALSLALSTGVMLSVRASETGRAARAAPRRRWRPG
jgi:membrane-associated phospholipid phosphatase